MKICYIAADVVIPYFRGASTHVFEVAKHLAELGNEVYVISRRFSRNQLSFEKISGFYVYRIYRGIAATLPFSKYKQPEIGERKTLKDKVYEKYLFTVFSYYAGLYAAQLITKHGLEIILERETSFGAGAIASAISGKPLILEIIGPRYSRFSFQKAQKILAYTKSMIHESPIPEKVVLVDAAADTGLFKPDLAQRTRIRTLYGISDSIVVGYVGTFVSWHGIEELIDASVELTKCVPNVKFLMVGPYFESAREYAQRKMVEDIFIFTGPVPYENVPALINAMDIAVAPYNPLKSALRSKYGIGSPLKIFEYMACGKPVITTHVEPIPKVVKHMKNGILIPPGDPKALAKAILTLTQNRQKMEELGEEGRQTVLMKYSWESFAKRLNEILREVIEKYSTGKS
jgi:glycosyltransferase involved in cell wall biosynthesis